MNHVDQGALMSEKEFIEVQMALLLAREHDGLSAAGMHTRNQR